MGLLPNDPSIPTSSLSSQSIVVIVIIIIIVVFIVIILVVDELCTGYEKHLKNFMMIYQLEACQEGGVKKGYLEDHLGFLIRDIEDRDIPDIMNDVF